MKEEKETSNVSDEKADEPTSSGTGAAPKNGDGKRGDGGKDSKANKTAEPPSTTNLAPPVMPQRSILRKPSLEQKEQPHESAPSGSTMAAHKRYYDYPPPPGTQQQQRGGYYGYGFPPYYEYSGPPPPGAGMPPGMPRMAGMGMAGPEGLGPGGPPPLPPSFRPFGYSPSRHPPYRRPPNYAGHLGAPPSAEGSPDRGSGQSRQAVSPRVSMGSGGPPPPWLGGAAVSPLRPPPPRAHFRPEAFRRRLPTEELEQQRQEAGRKDSVDHSSDRRGERPQEQGQDPTQNKRARLSKRSSDAGRYDDALLLAEVSKIAEDEAHHRTGISSGTGTGAGGADSGSSHSSDGDTAAGIHAKEKKKAGKSGGDEADGHEKSKDRAKVDEEQEQSSEGETFDDDKDQASKVTEVDKARRRFSDNAKLGAMASPILRSTRPSSQDEGGGIADNVKEEEEQHPSPIQLERPSLAAGPPRHYGRYIGRPVPPPYDEHGDYYSNYPPPSMPMTMRGGHHTRPDDSYTPYPQPGSGGEYYSPGGPYPAGPPMSYQFGGNAGVPIPSSSSFDKQSEQPEHGRSLHPEYTPPAPLFTRHAPRRPSKHVEVTPNSHNESPSSRLARSHSRDEDSVAAEAQSDQDRQQTAQKQKEKQKCEYGPPPSQRRARFDETTERDQEDRSRRRAAAEVGGSAGGANSGSGQTIPPFPSPRWGPSPSQSPGRGGGQRPYLPPPRPSAGSRFPYQDDGSREGAGFVRTVTPRESRGQQPFYSRSGFTATATPTPREYYEGPGWSPYPLHHHRRIPSGGIDIRPQAFDSPGEERGSTWGTSASWDNEDDKQASPATSGSDYPALSAPRTPRTPNRNKGHRKNLPSVSMDYGDSPPGNVVFTPRSSFEPMPENHRFLPPTPGGYYNDPADYADYGDYEFAAGPPHPPPPHVHQQRQRHPPPPPTMMSRNQQVPFHPGSPMALAQRQFSTPSNSGGSKYPPLSAFQGSQPTGGGYYPGGEDYYAGKTVIRRKCPWKNFPELEDFLIANREEYLRHSAMNYTSQQRQYNNRLTERLLELAAQHGYVFDEEDFDFVTVRDRIRCYYKSYVQSKRKKGIKVGYAPERKKAKVGEHKQTEQEKAPSISQEVASSSGK